MFGFPKADSSIKNTFKRNFLRTIVFQIKFEDTKVLFKNKSSIHRRFQTDYLRLIDSPNNYEIQINKNETPIVNTSKGEGFILRTNNGMKNLSFNTNSIELNIVGLGYNNFEEVYANELTKIVAVLEEFGIKNVNRIAIRKINAIGLSISQNSNMVQIAKDLLNPEIAYSFGIFPFEENIIHNVNSIHYKKETNGLNLKIGHSMPEQAIQVGHLICDIDRFATTVTPIEGILNEFSGFNQEVFDVFMWFLNEKSLKFLK